jgi:hypothetical protein
MSHATDRGLTLDLANGMMEKLVAKHAQREQGGGDRSILLEMMPRVLTAIMLQRDIPGVLSRMIGEGSEESLGTCTMCGDVVT